MILINIMPVLLHEHSINYKVTTLAACYIVNMIRVCVFYMATRGQCVIYMAYVYDDEI